MMPWELSMKKHWVATLLTAGALGLAGCLGRTGPAATATPLPLPTATEAVVATATVAAPATTAASAAPSDTAAPSATTASTATLSPTASAEPADTATPAAPPTPDPNEGVGDVVYQDRLDGNGGWFWTFSDDVANFGVEDGKLKGVMRKANSGWRFTISPPTLQQGNQQVSLSAHTVSCGQNDEYGLMLRLKNDADNTNFDGYLFKLRCSGAASFQMVTGTKVTTLVDWTPSPAIRPGAGGGSASAADNTLLVWAEGGNFRFYANGQYLFSAQDATLTSGFYGIYLYDRTAGGETVNFDTLVVKALTK
jgi:hypothetical protein